MEDTAREPAAEPVECVVVKEEALEPIQKLSPWGKSLYKALGGEQSFLALRANKVQHWGLDRPDSLLNLVGDDPIKDMALQIPEELLRKTDGELQQMQQPSRVDRRMRLAFWEEYERAACDNRTMDLANCHRNTGAVSWNAYRTHLADNPVVCAWFLSQPAAYKIQVAEAQSVGLGRVMEILELPIMDPLTGRVNVPIAGLILAAWKLIDQRLHGLPTNKTVNVNMEANIPKNATIDPTKLDEKLAELERLLNAREIGKPDAV